MMDSEAQQAYITPKALEMAVKAAAERSPMDTGRAVESFWMHRLLCRIFVGNNDKFVLKGGQAMLARTINARATRDIDLLSTRDDISDALNELEELASVDMGDHVRFVLLNTRPIKAADKHRNGAKATFETWVGSKRLSPVSIDLVVDVIPLGKAERLAPADRIELKGIQSCKYLIYPVEAALSDKFCGITEMHEGHQSSRIKDLIDIAIYATTSDIDGSSLRNRLQRELSARGMLRPNEFAIPDAWHQNAYAASYAKQAANTGLPDCYRSIDEAAVLAKALFDPILKGDADGMIWDGKMAYWK